MPRGRKKVIDERIEAKCVEIGRMEIRIKTLKTELKELEEEKQQELSVALAGAAIEAGLSIEQAIAKLRA